MMCKNIEEYKYDYLLGKWVNPKLIEELSKFYSLYYGIWSNNAPYSSGKNIMLSANKIKDWLDNELSELWTIRDNSKLIGYAISLKGKSGSKENVIWVTQFVIHSDYRNTGIGKRLLFSIWGFSSFFAWGLLTANPYAIRALEKATRRRCNPLRIKKNVQQVFNFGKKNVNYINEDTEKIVNKDTSKINTNFFVDHSELEEMLSNVTSEEKPWKLGQIEDGWEWFAFTFYDQKQIELSTIEIETMLNSSDNIAKEAYSRMLMDDTSHKWAKYTKQEISYILDVCNLNKKANILDVGCGMGRHSIELSHRGYTVTGLDYAEILINSAKTKAETEKINPTFLTYDITASELPFTNSSFDCILCLYDVIGSYVDDDKNMQILQNISSLLKSGGYVIISVMNLHLTEFIATKKFVLRNSSKELLSLSASNTMETTGDVFNPNYFLIDKETKVVYRKETFSYDNSYPKELIVRDKRYYEEDIINMCKEVNFEIMNKSFVNAGWQKEYNKTNRKAKEILLICRKK